MPAADSFIGEGLLHSPYQDALAEIKHWREAYYTTLKAGDIVVEQRNNFKRENDILKKTLHAVEADRDSWEAQSERYQCEILYWADKYKNSQNNN